MPGTDLLQVQRAFSPVNPTTRLGIPRVGETLPGQHGVMCEPARTNLFFNPSAKVGLTYISSIVAGTTVTQDTTIGLQTGTSAKVVCDGTASAQGYANQTLPPQGAGTYVGSVWVYSRSGGEQVTIYTRANPLVGALIQSTQAYVLKAGWQRLVSAAIVIPQGTSVNFFNVFVRTTVAQACTFWCTDAQLEKALGYSANDVYPTSFIDGSSSPASAYSWDASPVTTALSNGSFESGTTGWTAESGCQITAVTTQHYIGSQSCQVSSTGDFYQFASGIAAGQVWTLSGAFLIPTTMATAPTINISARNGGTVLQNWSLTLPTTAAAWTQFALTTDALPATTNTVLIYITGGVAADPAWFIDALQFEHSSHATTFANPGTALGSSATRAETRLGYTLPTATAGQYSIVGWAKLGFTPTASTGTRILCAAASSGAIPDFGFSGLQFTAYDGVGATNITPTTPFAAGDVFAFGILMDPVGLTTQAWLYHNGSLQMGAVTPRASVPPASALWVGSYDITAAESTASYAAESFVGPVAIFGGLLSANDIQRYIDLGTFDPTRDPRIQTLSGYGSEQQGLMFWQAGVSASGGVVQAIGSFTGQIYKDDGQGNALAYNQRRFALLLAENPNYNGLTIGQQIALNAIDGSIELVDVWTVTSLHSSDPSQVDIICTHS